VHFGRGVYSPATCPPSRQLFCVQCPIGPIPFCVIFAPHLSTDLDPATRLLRRSSWWELRPLFLRRHFGFGEREYSALLILATATSTLAVATFPRLQRRAGVERTVVLLGGGAAAALLSAFVVQAC